MKKLFAATVIAMNLVGCASVNMGSAQQDATAKTFMAPAAKAGIYVYRNETMGAAIKMDVSIDGQRIGETAAKTYLYKEVQPGKHTIESKAENTDKIEVDAKPGMLYFIWQEVKMGVLGARNKLSLVSEAEGKKGVNESKLAETK